MPPLVTTSSRLAPLARITSTLPAGTVWHSCRLMRPRRRGCRAGSPAACRYRRGGVTQASTRKFFACTTPAQSNAAVMRRTRSPRGGEERGADQQQDERAHARTDRSTAGAARRPGLQRIARRAAPARHGRATARARPGSCSPAASSSASAVAGRCASPLPRSSRRRPSKVLGRRKRSSGTAATAISTTRANSAIARPSGGSHSHKPGQETARNSADRDGERSQRRPEPLPENRPPRPPQRARQQACRRLARRHALASGRPWDP